MSVPGILDDHQMFRYRELLDAEETAFDELEHAYEDGDRERYATALAGWRLSWEAKSEFLLRNDVFG